MSLSVQTPHPQYSEAYCSAQYNMRAMVPDHQQVFSRWARHAATFRNARKERYEYAYGVLPGERLDLFGVSGSNAPLLVFIHGGFWRSLDKSDFSWLAAPFNARGVAVAVVNYSLAPQATLETIVRQNLRASDWLWRNATTLGYDRGRMIVSGHSAGAHLAAMLMCAHWPQWSSDLPMRLYQGALLLSGIFDLEPLMHAHFLNVDLQLTPDRCAALSPLYMKPVSLAAIHTVVGALESDEFKRQTESLVHAWHAVHGEQVSAAGENHFTVCDRLADPGHALFKTALRMCREARSV